MHITLFMVRFKPIGCFNTGLFILAGISFNRFWHGFSQYHIVQAKEHIPSWIARHVISNYTIKGIIAPT